MNSEEQEALEALAGWRGVKPDERGYLVGRMPGGDWVVSVWADGDPLVPGMKHTRAWLRDAVNAALSWRPGGPATPEGGESDAG
jgi:hypothetical protein